MRSLLTAALLLLTLGAAGAEWVDFPNPDTRTGLVIQPRFLNLRGKLLLFWAGTSVKAPGAEICVVTKEEGADGWSGTRAPFFGEDLGRVRRLAVATGRDITALAFERTPGQGGNAIEVLLALSTDRGYSFNPPYVLDSFVTDDLGSWISVAARQGTRRDEVAAAWIADSGKVRVASVDLRSVGYRPEASTVGTARESSNRVEMATAGTEGFFATWVETKGLKTCRVKPLTGGAEASVMLSAGDYQKNFCTASGGYKGPAYTVAGDEAGGLAGWMEGDGKFTALESGKLSLSKVRNLESRCATDSDKKLHVALLSADKSEHKVYYTHNKGGKWSTPQVALELDPSVPSTGFDICVVDDHVYVVAAQGQRLTIKRQKI